MKNWVARLICSCALFSLCWANPLLARFDENFNVLVLHSYSADYQWTNDIQAGIAEAFATHSPGVQIRIEFMDTKNISQPEYLAYLAELYSYKYQDNQPSGVILSDNNAVDFFERYGHSVFPDAKVVACGINRAMPPPLHSQVDSVIAELGDHQATLKHAIAMKPDAQNIYIVSDSSTTGEALLQEVKAVIPQLPTNAKINFLQGRSYEQLYTQARQFKANDLVYLLPYFQSAEGDVYQQNEIGRMLAQISPAPVFVSWKFQFVAGIAGGQLMSGQKNGEQAALSLLRLLRSEHIENFQVNLPLTEPVFDHIVMQRHQIPGYVIPKGAQIINQPVSFWHQHQQVVLPGLGVMIALLLMLLLLLWSLKKQRVLNEKNKAMILLDKEVIETQRELVTTLGEMIDVRSSETRNHVIRVAKIARYLGDKLGLSDDDLALLEAAAPMHDVGKISIPESILNKQGMLTEEENFLMREHTRIGYKILSCSERPLLKVASRIALQHHEHWDGSGYPQGLQGEQIDTFARIITIADVYDAISSERCYKEAWEENKVMSYILNQRGKIFEPRLVDIFVANINEIRAIRNQFS